jgi:hypothetical protein
MTLCYSMASRLRVDKHFTSAYSKTASSHMTTEPFSGPLLRFRQMSKSCLMIRLPVRLSLSGNPLSIGVQSSTLSQKDHDMTESR